MIARLSKVVLCIGIIFSGNIMSYQHTGSQGQQYLDFIVHLDSAQFLQQSNLLFASNVKKIVNSQLICNNRNELMQQMFNVWDASGGVEKVDLLESISNADNSIEIIRFEIFFKDGAVESVISILKKDDDGLLYEINEVFGEKCIYQWP